MELLFVITYSLHDTFKSVKYFGNLPFKVVNMLVHFLSFPFHMILLKNLRELFILLCQIKMLFDLFPYLQKIQCSGKKLRKWKMWLPEGWQSELIRC